MEDEPVGDRRGLLNRWRGFVRVRVGISVFRGPEFKELHQLQPGCTWVRYLPGPPFSRRMTQRCVSWL